MTKTQIVETESNLGIPKAVFIDDVEKYMQDFDDNSQVAMKKLDDSYQKYRVMEANLSSKKKRLMEQIPELESTLDIVKHLDARKASEEAMTTKFLLAGSLYAKAIVPPTDKVCLWLGANVMLTYTTHEALELVQKNLESAIEKLAEVNKNMNFLRDQSTTTEVSMAQVYNWDVKNKRSKKVAGVAGDN